MQRFDIPLTLDGLKDVLIAHGGLTYFDEITTEVDNNYNKTNLTKNGSSITISVTNSINSTYHKMFVNNKELDAALTNDKPDALKFVYVTDSALVIIPYNSQSSSSDPLYTVPIIICKTQNGYTCVFHGVYKSGSGYVGFSGYNEKQDFINTTRCIIIDNNGVTTTLELRNAQNNTNENVLSTAVFSGKADTTKDVYYVTNRPFHDTAQPFMLSIDGISYASFAYNSILIKTT